MTLLFLLCGCFCGCSFRRCCCCSFSRQARPTPIQASKHSFRTFGCSGSLVLQCTGSVRTISSYRFHMKAGKFYSKRCHRSTPYRSCEKVRCGRKTDWARPETAIYYTHLKLTGKSLSDCGLVALKHRLMRACECLFA